MAGVIVHVSICVCSVAELEERVLRTLDAHLARMGREGMVRAALADEIVDDLRAAGLRTREDWPWGSE